MEEEEKGPVVCRQCHTHDCEIHQERNFFFSAVPFFSSSSGIVPIGSNA